MSKKIVDSSIEEAVNEKEHIIHLKNITVHDVYGLDASVDFDRNIVTNLTGDMGGGRTRFFKCFLGARSALCTGYAMLPDMFEGKVTEASDISITLTYDDLECICIVRFKKGIAKWNNNEYYKCALEWRGVNENGEVSQVYQSGQKEEVDDDFAIMISDCIWWLTHNVITDMDEAMEHMSGLPYRVLGIIGVHDRWDFSDNIGRFMPWLCCLSDMKDCVVWMDDIFDGIHQLVIQNFVEYVGREFGENNQFILSSRQYRGLKASGSCWFFHSGRAVLISRREFNGREREQMYRLQKIKEDDLYLCRHWHDVVRCYLEDKKYEYGEQVDLIQDVVNVIEKKKEVI